MRKPAFCICENKDADQLRGNREADLHLGFRYIDSTIPLLPKYEISSLEPYCVVVQPGLCGNWSETPKPGFLTTRLKLAVKDQDATCDCHQTRTAKLISTFFFATRIVQFLCFLNQKFQASSHLLWLYSLVCVGTGRKP